MVISQEGTNQILKNKSSEPRQLFDKFVKLLEAVDGKYEPETIEMCEVRMCEVRITRNKHQNNKVPSTLAQKV